MINKKDKGRKGEVLAATYLLDRGYKILKKNYRYRRQEIDLIAQQSKQLIFVEVKTRLLTKIDHRDTLLSARQQLGLKRTLKIYLLNNKEKFRSARLDLILVLIDQVKNKVLIKHYQDI